MRVHGRCHCGAIHFEADVDPEQVIICHCTDCQTISGAPYRVNAPVSLRSFKLHGSPTQYKKNGSSGTEIATAFCGICGSALFSQKSHDPRFVNL